MSQEFIKGSTETRLKPRYDQLVTVAAFWQGKPLLIHRQTEPFKGMFSIPGGGVEDGEAYEEAARRELVEETGIKAAKLVPLGIFVDDEHKLECHGFMFDSPDGHFSSPPNEEQEVIGWRTIEEAVALPLTPGLREVFLAMRDSEA